MPKSRVAVDLLGSETSPTALLQVLLESGRQLSADQELILVGLQEHQPAQLPARVSFVVAKEAVTMDESPLEAVRRKRHSSLSMGIQLLRDGDADAFITLGNTGALVATATLFLPRLPGIERPALLATLPTHRGEVAVLDVGAQVAPSPHQLVQYARMGSAFSRAVLHIENPQVGLLNIGEEARKGTAAARQAYLALEATPHFVGNVEGREVFQGRVDVLVTDGFTGNIFLKTSEGVCSFLLEQAGPAVRHEMARWERYVREPVGAMLIGLNHLVMKCHGASSPASVTATLRMAFEWLRQGILPSITESLG